MFTDVTPPGSVRTIAQGINRFGRITGDGRTRVAADAGRYGFVWQQSPTSQGKRQFAPFLERLSIADGTSSARGINDSDQIAGFTFSGGVQVGFVGDPLNGFELIVPPGGPWVNGVFCEGINNRGEMVCSSTDADFNTFAFFVSQHEGDEDSGER